MSTQERRGVKAIAVLLVTLIVLPPASVFIAWAVGFFSATQAWCVAILAMAQTLLWMVAIVAGGKR